MKTIYLNCENGVSGDMVLNALVGLTEDPDAVRAWLRQVEAKTDAYEFGFQRLSVKRGTGEISVISTSA